MCVCVCVRTRVWRNGKAITPAPALLVAMEDHESEFGAYISAVLR